MEILACCALPNNGGCVEGAATFPGATRQTSRSEASAVLGSVCGVVCDMDILCVDDKEHRANGVLTTA